jgi:branched-chain amino acid transport system ATP-binding protein
MLEVRNASVAYGGVQVLWQVSLSVAPGEIVCLLGPNGSGKSTLMNSISRLLPLKEGEITYEGVALHKAPPHRVIRHGLSHVLERHRLFPYMTVRENLLLGAGPGAVKERITEGLERVHALFPRLAERGGQMAHTLSGGEQQMCAIGRGLMSRPRLLMVDEPFIGLSPLLRNEVARALVRINQDGVAILLIEQNVREALKISRRAYVLQAGRLALEGPSDDLLASTAVEAVFFGRAREGSA